MKKRYAENQVGHIFVGGPSLSFPRRRYLLIVFIVEKSVDMLAGRSLIWIHLQVRLSLSALLVLAASRCLRDPDS